MDIYEQIAWRTKGYNQDQQQCFLKVKQFARHVPRPGRPIDLLLSCTPPHFSNELYAILGRDPSSTIDTSEEPKTEIPPMNREEELWGGGSSHATSQDLVKTLPRSIQSHDASMDEPGERERDLG